MDSLRDRIATLLRSKIDEFEHDGDLFKSEAGNTADRILALFSDELDKVDDLNDLRGKIGDK